MSARAWVARRSKNPYRRLAHRTARRGQARRDPCRWCGRPWMYWQWRIGRWEMAGLSRKDCGCWFDTRDEQGAARGRLNHLLVSAAGRKRR